MTTVVRPSEADLSAIARRIAGPLSPEGAEAWYRNDGAIMLEEIVRLRREAEAARRKFYEDGAQAELDATLHDWALAWKAQATGFWEKAQTKTLRQQLAEQRFAVATHKESLATVEDLNRVLVTEKAALAAEVGELRQAHDVAEQTYESERSGFLRRIAELDGLLDQAREELVQNRTAASHELESCLMRAEEHKAYVKDLLRQVVEAL